MAGEEWINLKGVARARELQRLTTPGLGQWLEPVGV